MTRGVMEVGVQLEHYVAQPEAGTRMDVQSGRVEKRLPISVQVWLTSFNRPGPFERAVTENVSPAGARIIIGTRWPPEETTVVLCSPGCVANAQIVYSQPLPHDSNQFAIGLRLQGATRGWPVQASDTA